MAIFKKKEFAKYLSNFKQEGINNNKNKEKKKIYKIKFKTRNFTPQIAEAQIKTTTTIKKRMNPKTKNNNLHDTLFVFIIFINIGN